MAKQYRYVGDGAGVPGLPHLISDEEAKALGVTQVLADAIKNGSYREIKTKQGESSEKES
jgi:hypothetical protein